MPERSGRLQQAAADHRRSLAQEALVALESGLDGAADQPRRLSVEDSLDWLKAEVWTLPILDRRADEQILGYNAAGYTLYREKLRFSHVEH